MSSHVIHARPPRGDAGDLGPIDDPGRQAAYLEDAAHVAGGHLDALFVPGSEAAIAAIVRQSPSVLVVGAQSSLTGGATPIGGSLMSTARLNGISFVGDTHVRVQAGVTLTALNDALAPHGCWYPPSPTFLGATAGGIVSTNAAGASTFKYGATRAWVDAMTVVLANGDVLELVRGMTRSDGFGGFEIHTSSGIARVPAPTYRLPDVPKISAGYFSAPDLDLLDLFIGSEGTLGIVTDVTLRVLRARPAECLLFVTFPDRDQALACVEEMRTAARHTWIRGDGAGIDVSGIEHMDARSLALLREDGLDRKTGVDLPADAALALLITIELPAETTAADAYHDIGCALDPAAPDTPLTRLCALLASYHVLERTIVAAPGDRRRAQALMDLREAVPVGVNRRIGEAKATIDQRIEKTAGDMIVPFEALGRLMAIYDDEFKRRGLDAATWGHISDGNLHPNVIPRSFADVESGRQALLNFGAEVVRLGGAPLSEHGVGRNATKQALLRSLYGDAGIEIMRRVKDALDPEGKLAPGVIVGR